MEQEQVTQADRDAAAKFWGVEINDSYGIPSLEKAFARHRLQSTAALRDAADRLAAMLGRCAEKFEHYEALHRLKSTPEGDEKADRNREMADAARAELAQYRDTVK